MLHLYTVFWARGQWFLQSFIHSPFSWGQEPRSNLFWLNVLCLSGVIGNKMFVNGMRSQILHQSSFAIASQDVNNATQLNKAPCQKSLSNPSLPFFFCHQLISLLVFLASLFHLSNPQSTYPFFNWQNYFPKISHIPSATKYWHSSNQWTFFMSFWETPPILVKVSTPTSLLFFPLWDTFMLGFMVELWSHTSAGKASLDTQRPMCPSLLGLSSPWMWLLLNEYSSFIFHVCLPPMTDASEVRDQNFLIFRSVAFSTV